MKEPPYVDTNPSSYRPRWTRVAARWIVVTVVSLLWLIAGCTPDEPVAGVTPTTVEPLDASASPTPFLTPDPSPAAMGAVASEIGHGLQTWEALDVHSYTVVVMEASIWHMQVHTITVAHERIDDASATCTPAPLEFGSCEVREFVPETYIVPGLFAEAYRQAGYEGGAYTHITFDPTYGFPNLIRFDDPRAMDEETTWRVLNFEPEEGG